MHSLLFTDLFKLLFCLYSVIGNSWVSLKLSTQEQMAEVLHTQKSNISRLENANSVNSPKLSTIEQYAQAIG